MADSDGVLSQAVANLQDVTGCLFSLAGLPPGADAARATVTQSVNSAIPVVRASSCSVLAFVDTARPLVTSAMAALEGGDADGVRSAVTAVANASALVKSSIETSTAAIQTAIGDINGQLGALSGIDSTLWGQITQANSEAQSAQDAADELDKKKLYWLLLGPFGLIGLGVCIGMIVDANNRIAQIQARVSTLRGQSAQWTKMKTDVDLAIAELPVIGSKLQNLQNSVDFVSSDVSEVIADVGKGGSGSAIARAFLMTAQHELEILSRDAA